jgi:transposase-like protein
MTANGFRMRCQRCGADMEMRDPEPGGPWKPDQFWVCPRCGRHFWTTYTSPPAVRTSSDTAGTPGKN